MITANCRVKLKSINLGYCWLINVVHGAAVSASVNTKQLINLNRLRTFHLFTAVLYLIVFH